MACVLQSGNDDDSPLEDSDDEEFKKYKQQRMDALKAVQATLWDPSSTAVDVCSGPFSARLSVWIRSSWSQLSRTCTSCATSWFTSTKT